jgi:hypothetical protein
MQCRTEGNLKWNLKERKISNVEENYARLIFNYRKLEIVYSNTVRFYCAGGKH